MPKKEALKCTQTTKESPKENWTMGIGKAEKGAPREYNTTTTKTDPEAWTKGNKINPEKKGTMNLN